MARSYDARRSVAASLLKLARLKSGLSQGALAEQAGVPATMVSAYERDERQPTLPTLMRLLAAAGFELRLHLEPLDPSDAILEETARWRGARGRRQHAAQVERWRNAKRLDA